MFTASCFLFWGIPFRLSFCLHFRIRFFRKFDERKNRTEIRMSWPKNIVLHLFHLVKPGKAVLFDLLICLYIFSEL